jgi:SdrD B-like domain
MRLSTGLKSVLLSVLFGFLLSPQIAATEQGDKLGTAEEKAGTGFRCLPSCSQVDARLLAVSGANLFTLSGHEINLTIIVAADISSFQLGIFDGDVRGTDAAGVSHWDIGVGSLYEYTLYADPFGDGTGTGVVEMLPGLQSVASTTMPDNAWLDFTVSTGAEAQSPGGPFFYRLHAALTDPTLTTLNAFKVRTTGVLVGPQRLGEEPFSYIATFTSVGDAQTVYPAYPASPTPSTYDGRFDFYFELPVSRTSLTVWDGDFDRGKFDGTELDTDDPDTPSVMPPWATGDTLPEGVARGVLGTTGNPPDDRNPVPATMGLFILKSPSIRYDLTFPDGRSFVNENPSGNQEWEQLKISTEASDPLIDYATASVPMGLYRLRIAGVDMQNLNALLLPGRVLGVDVSGVPGTPLRPFLVGDLVFRDSNSNGVQDTGNGDEPGLPGITLELLDELGERVASTVTTADGSYSFPAEAETYTVRTADANFAPGGPLAGWISTTGDSATATVVDDNVRTLDLGYRPKRDVGGRHR